MIARVGVLLARGVAAPLVLFLSGILIALSPVWFQGKLLFSYDFLFEFYPLAAAEKRAWEAGEFPFWNPFHQGGVPLLADPVSNALYPPNALLTWLLPVDVALVVFLALHLLLCFLSVYWLCGALGVSRPGATLSSLTYCFGNYVLVRTVWPNSLAVFALLPLVLFCIERSFSHGGRSGRFGWIAGAATAYALLLLGGLPQLSVYASLAIAMFVVWRGLGRESRGFVGLGRRLGSCVGTGLGVLGLGFGLAAVQLLPVLSYLTVSNRSSGYDGASGGLALSDLARVLWGDSAMELMTAYLGGAILLFICLGVVGRSRPRSSYWIALMLLGVGLSLREPDWWVSFVRSIPIVGGFFLHAPERVFFIFVLGASVTAGFGLDMVLRGSWSRRGKIAAIVGVGCGVALLLWLVAPANVMSLRHSPQFVVTCGAVFVVLIGLTLARGRVRSGLVGLLLMIVVADLLVGYASHGERFDNLGQYLGQSTSAQYLTDRVATGQPTRILGLNGLLKNLGYDRVNTARDYVGGNSAMVYGLEDVQGYSPTHLARYWKFLEALNAGTWEDWHLKLVWNLSSPLLKYLNVGYVVVPKGFEQWSSTHMIQKTLSADSRGTVLTYPDRPRASRFSLVSRLGHSTEVQQGDQIGTVMVWTDDGRLFKLPARAGIETSESAYDRPDVKPLLKHARVETAPLAYTQIGKGDLWFNCTFELPETVGITAIKFEWDVEGEGTRAIWHLDHVSIPIAKESVAQKEATLGEYEVWSFKEVLPRAMLVPAVEIAPEADMLSIMQDPSFNPTRRALLASQVQTDVPVVERLSPDSAIEERATVSYSRDSMSTMSIHTFSDAPRYLIVSENWYSAWKASVDGAPVEIQRANYMFLGLPVPPGDHEVRIWYQDTSFEVGLVISIVCVLTLASGFALVAIRRRGR